MRLILFILFVTLSQAHAQTQVDDQKPTDFITLSPVPGISPEQNTKVKVLYDDDAIYVSAEMEEVSRDSILTELTPRDNVGNTDAFMVLLDTYRNGTDGILLLVAATGVKEEKTLNHPGVKSTLKSTGCLPKAVSLKISKT